jgi:hypothetical protein
MSNFQKLGYFMQKATPVSIIEKYGKATEKIIFSL